MREFKLFVLLLCSVVIQGYRSRYCEICVNHTLCKYPVGGPTNACKSFDKKAILSDSDIADIVNRINARRNLVALGHLRKFPQAANMRKVRWSIELASFAQRWADQCDPSLRPNKEDECRDMVGIKVGQSIAAVVGPAPGLHVKSFVDMWFMSKLHYTGSVMYYNRSRDDKTSYFTQLIWANTEYVGCGRIKFFNEDINTVVERVVCNFASKGNNQGKPVYALGYPATQCPNLMTPDSEFSGMCKRDLVTATEIIPVSSVSSLLRILESSNSSASPDLDPNNLKLISFNRTEINDQRNQKTRHAYGNGPYGGVKRDSFHMHNPRNPLKDPDNFKGQQFTKERGHSRMYHGHLTKIDPIQNFHNTQPYSEQGFRRFNVATQPNPLSVLHDHDHATNGRRISGFENGIAAEDRRIVDMQNEYVLGGRRSYNDHVCTRKPKGDDCFPKPCRTNQCTRGQSHSCNACLKPQSCNSCLQSSLPPDTPSLDLCPCKNSYTQSSPCDLNLKCPVCPSQNCPTSESTLCAKRRAQEDYVQDSNKSAHFNYYDLFPNIGLRNGDENERKQFEHTEFEDDLQYKAKESVISGQVNEITENIQTTSHEPQDSYDIFYSSERKRRNFEDQMTFKPFWQVDEFNHKRPSELKSLRYTTLANYRNRKTRRTTTLSRLPTESITIKSHQRIIHNGTREQTTEKYLSFDELMHLRKLSTLQAFDYEARRLGGEEQNLGKERENLEDIKKKQFQNKPGATKKSITKPATTLPTVPAARKAADINLSASLPSTLSLPDPAVVYRAAPDTVAAADTTTITPNTPFIRMKQCTRKITCTWTALVMAGESGGGAQGMIIEAGSRTPPGYVEGCSRTSTCTRDFMDRNKMPVSTEETPFDESSTTEDEEYCEKRSLDIQRRNLDDLDRQLGIEFQETITEVTPSPSKLSHVTNRDIPHTEVHDCICNDDNHRIKRNEKSFYEQFIKNNCDGIIKDLNANSHDNDIYNIVKKITNSSKSNTHRCACSDQLSIFINYSFKSILNYSLTYTFYMVMSCLQMQLV